GAYLGLGQAELLVKAFATALLREDLGPAGLLACEPRELIENAAPDPERESGMPNGAQPEDAQLEQIAALYRDVGRLQAGHFFRDVDIVDCIVGRACGA